MICGVREVWGLRVRRVEVGGRCSGGVVNGRMLLVDDRMRASDNGCSRYSRWNIDHLFTWAVMVLRCTHANDFSIMIRGPNFPSRDNAHFDRGWRGSYLHAWII